MKPLLIWILEHPRLFPFIILLLMLAFVAGEAYQYCQQDKKAAKREHA